MKGEAAVWGAVLLLADLRVLGAGAPEATIQHRLQREGVRVRGLVVATAGKAPRRMAPPAVLRFADDPGAGRVLRSAALPPLSWQRPIDSTPPSGVVVVCEEGVGAVQDVVGERGSGGGAGEEDGAD
jgi:hypothetical protein